MCGVGGGGGHTQVNKRPTHASWWAYAAMVGTSQWHVCSAPLCLTYTRETAYGHVAAVFCRPQRLVCVRTTEGQPLSTDLTLHWGWPQMCVCWGGGGGSPYDKGQRPIIVLDAVRRVQRGVMG